MRRILVQLGIITTVKPAHLLTCVFFAISLASLPAAPKQPFPTTLDAFLGPSAPDEVRTVDASASIGNTRYYIISRSFEFEGGQMLLSETGGKVTLLGADSFIFPLSRYKKLPPAAATALLDAYVRQQIVQRGKLDIQKDLQSPLAADFIPPDLMDAYRRAGIAP
jgi:hypothetical protein